MDTNDFANTSTSTNKKFSSKLSSFKKPNMNFGNTSAKFKNVKKTHLYIGGILIAFVLVFLAGRYFAPATTLGDISGGDPRTAAPTPIATQELNKTFDFPLLDEKNKEVAKIKYMLESANLQDAFIYQGKTATAVKGRTFLIFNLKITNPYSKTIEINSKDYIRVKMNGSEEQLAPEIHNDPVQIQADSTKYTRIGLPINDTDKDIILLVGELNGKKETIKLNLEK